MSVTTLGLDYEGKSECDLTKEGGYRYATDMTTEPLLLGYHFNNDPVTLLDFTQGDTLPPEVKEALADPEVEKWAFNAAFERLFTKFVMGIDTPIKGWRCTMALAYMRSFNGGLGEVGTQLGFPASQMKDPEGKRLIRLFCMPQRITKNQPHLWRDRHTDPQDWDKFRRYCVRDVEAEHAIKEKLIGLPTLAREWHMYEIDQAINDRGLPVDRKFVVNADKMATIRKLDLIEQMRDITDLKNPNSAAQLIPWLQDGGYQFNDLQKLTVKKALAENKEKDEFATDKLSDIVVDVLKLRQQSARVSVRKYPAILKRLDDLDDRMRHCFQFAGASRTNRFSGRGPQPHNLVRTPKELEALEYMVEGKKWKEDLPSRLIAVTEAIRDGDYELLAMLTKEPMDCLAGAVRSAFRAPEGYEFVVCDLSAIESAVIGWLAECARMLDVFASNRDPYKDFAVELYKVIYEEVTSFMRSICKPAVLGCGFGLGGGMLKEGKRTGLWGYAEGMGVNITRDEAAKQVALFREIYKEVPDMWKAMDDSMTRAMRGETVDYKGKLRFKKRGDYMMMELPTGRNMFYYEPEMKQFTFPGKPRKVTYEIENADGTSSWVKGEEAGTPYKVMKFTCMGMSQISKRWERIQSGGPKLTENAVQATAREVLVNGMRRAQLDGFNIVGHVHDELICLQKKGDNYYTLDRLRAHMTHREFWMGDLPLKAAGYTAEIYRKD